MRVDVAVVGGGVVGLACALALERAGFDVALVERGRAPPQYRPEDYDLRVYALAPASARFLAQLDAWAGVVRLRVSAYAEMRVWDEDSRSELHFSAAEAGVPELGWIVENQVLASFLWSRLERVRRCAGVTVTDCGLDARNSWLGLSDGQRLEAALVVSAEGAESFLRERAGIEADAWDYAEEALVCHVETGVPHRATAWQRFLPTGPLAFLPLADGRCSIVWSIAREQAEALAALDDEAFCLRLDEASQGRLGPLRRPTPRLRFPLRRLHAQHYVAPGLALVGDSAHVVHPLAGQGLNLGLADVEALVQVLAEARARGQRLGSERVLKRYERARRAANAEMLLVTDALQRMFSLRYPGWNALRQWGLAAVERFAPLRGALARRAMGL